MPENLKQNLLNFRVFSHVFYHLSVLATIWALIQMSNFLSFLLCSWWCLVLFCTANLKSEKEGENYLCYRLSSNNDLKFDVWAKNWICFVSKVHWRIPTWACYIVWFLLILVSHSSAFKMLVYTGNISIFPARKCHSELDFFFVKLCKQKAVKAGETENSVKLNMSQRPISCLLALIIRNTSSLSMSSNTVF